MLSATDAEKPFLNTLIFLMDVSNSMGDRAFGEWPVCIGGRRRIDVTRELFDWAVQDFRELFRIPDKGIAFRTFAIGAENASEEEMRTTEPSGWSERGTSLYNVVATECRLLYNLKQIHINQGLPFTGLLIVLTDGQNTLNTRGQWRELRDTFKNCHKGTYCASMWIAARDPSSDAATTADDMGSFYWDDFGKKPEYDHRALTERIRTYFYEPALMTQRYGGQLPAQPPAQPLAQLRQRGRGKEKKRTGMHTLDDLRQEEEVELLDMKRLSSYVYTS